MARPYLRAQTETGRTYDDPSEDLLFILLEDIADGDKDFLIVERTADPGGQTYIQVARNGDGFVVEYRDGAPDRHFSATSDDLRLVHKVMTGWAFELADWRGHLTWEQQRY